ncbi:MAG: DinB family protein [Ilyomonas sp.]
MPRPANGEFAPHFQKYIDLVKGNNIADIIANHEAELSSFYNALPEEKAEYAYAENKWTIKEVLQHLIDAERIFAYRALRIARNDSTPLPGFDEDSYAENANANSRSLSSLKDEFNAVRNASDKLLLSLTEEQLQHKGTSSNHSSTSNSFAYMIYGHLLHHKNILQERYLAEK